MKIRQGFVTNSSSSSFVVAVKKDVKEKGMKTFLENMFDEGFSDEQGYKNHVLWNYGYDSIEDMKKDSYIYKQYEKCIEAIKEGYQIIDADVEYDAAEQFDTMVVALEKAGVAKIITRE